MGTPCYSQKTWAINENLSAKHRLISYKFLVKDATETTKRNKLLPLLLVTYQSSIALGLW